MPDPVARHRSAVTPTASLKRALPRSTTQTRSMARMAANKFDSKGITDYDSSLGGLQRKRAPLSEQLQNTQAARKSAMEDGQRPAKMQRTVPSHHLAEASPSTFKSPRKLPTTPSRGFVLSQTRPPSSPLAGMKTQINMDSNWSPDSESSEDTLLLKPTPVKERDALIMGDMVVDSPSRLQATGPARPSTSTLPSFGTQASLQQYFSPKPAPTQEKLSHSSPDRGAIVRSPKLPSASRFKMPTAPHRPSALGTERPIESLTSSISKPMANLPRPPASYAQPTAASAAKSSGSSGANERTAAVSTAAVTLKRRASAAPSADDAKRARKNEPRQRIENLVRRAVQKEDDARQATSFSKGSDSLLETRSAMPPPRSLQASCSTSTGQSTSTIPVLSKLSAVPRRPSTMPPPLKPQSDDVESSPSSPRKPSYPSSLGSGPLAKPTNRVVSNPLVRPSVESSTLATIPGGEQVFQRPESPSAVSDPLNKPQNRRTSLNLETSKSLHGLSAALAKLQMPKAKTGHGSKPLTRTPRSSAESLSSVSSVSSGASKSRLSLPSSSDRESIADIGNRKAMSRQSYPPGKSDDTNKAPETNLRIFKGVIAAVDVRTSDGDDSSQYFADILRSCGARVSRLCFFVRSHCLILFYLIAGPGPPRRDMHARHLQGRPLFHDFMVPQAA